MSGSSSWLLRSWHAVSHGGLGGGGGGDQGGDNHDKAAFHAAPSTSPPLPRLSSTPVYFRSSPPPLTHLGFFLSREGALRSLLALPTLSPHLPDSTVFCGVCVCVWTDPEYPPAGARGLRLAPDNSGQLSRCFYGEMVSTLAEANTANMELWFSQLVKESTCMRP